MQYFMEGLNCMDNMLLPGGVCHIALLTLYLPVRLDRDLDPWEGSVRAAGVDPGIFI